MEIRISSLTDSNNGANQRPKKEVRAENELMWKIIERAWPEMKRNYKTKLDLMMDIDTANEDCPLKLEELLKADDMNFYHDIIGIGNNLNRQTKKLENCFLPRYAK